jgi:hypothetical protein
LHSYGTQSTRPTISPGRWQTLFLCLSLQMGVTWHMVDGMRKLRCGWSETSLPGFQYLFPVPTFKVLHNRKLYQSPHHYLASMLVLLPSLLALLIRQPQVDATKPFAQSTVNDITEEGHDDPYGNFFAVRFVCCHATALLLTITTRSLPSPLFLRNCLTPP